MDPLATSLTVRVPLRRAAALATIASLAIVASARAHAFLERAVPAVGSTVDASPAAVTLDFTEEIEAGFSSVDVFDAARGAPVDAPPMEHPTPTSLTRRLPPLAAGTYEVRWSVLSIDTHKTDGRFTFHVAPR